MIRLKAISYQCFGHCSSQKIAVQSLCYILICKRNAKNLKKDLKKKKKKKDRFDGIFGI